MSNETLPRPMPLENRRRAIVVGASSGIGAALVEQLVQNGYFVAALARREEKLAELGEEIQRITGDRRVLTYAHDATDYDDVPALFDRVVADLGGLDLIVYCAGVQPTVDVDAFDFARDRQMVAVNLLGAMAWLDQAAARFRRAGQGHIAAVSSISGDRGRVMNPGYHASKGGLSIYLESLRNRLSRHGVTVTTIKPGFVDTRLLAEAGGANFWVISPEDAARQIVDAVHAGKQVQYVPARWGLVALVIRHIPSFIFRRLSL